jgi:hypothetical protein
VSEVTTLKQLMLDAARYRWARENLYSLLDWSDSCGYDMTGSACDEYIDRRLDSE